MNNQPNLIAILEGGPADHALAESLTREGLPVVCFHDLEALIHSGRLSSIGVLVFRVSDVRLGSLLIALSLLSLEYPGLRKVAIVEESMSVILAAYLSACSVEFLETYLDASGLERVVRSVRRILEQRTWCFAPGQELTWGLRSREVQHASATRH
jgi:hypothetical protein